MLLILLMAALAIPPLFFAIAARTAAKQPTPAARVSIVPVAVATVATDQVVPALMYHHVMPKPNNSIAISPATFDQQMKYLSDHGFHSVSMAQFKDFVLTGKRLPSKPVLITFDDGRLNQLTYAVPILRKYGFTATFFVIERWATSHEADLLHLGDLRTLVAEGFDVQSHTTRHRYMRSFHGETYAGMSTRYDADLAGMRTWLTDNVSQDTSIVALAYPGGFYDTNVEKLTAASGYSLAFTVNWGYVKYGKVNHYAIPRWNTGARGLSFKTFKKIVNHSYRY
jgi:peptidoglycan/xylan/chitin deacetylase (PgdA/CDA1 family)